MHSYKVPRKKPLFSKDSMLWIFFVSVISISLLGFGLYLRYKTYKLTSVVEEKKTVHQTLSEKVAAYEKELKIHKMQRTLSKEVKASNGLLKNSIKNLFDLVPDQIVLTKVMMQKDMLNLEGLTPTKDTYRLLLEPPLKSIFSSSQVSYQFNGRKGRYEFKSVNRMDASIGETNGEKK